MVQFLIYQYLIYLHQILDKLNQFFQQKIMYQLLLPLFKSAFVVQVDKSNSNLTLLRKDFGSGKYSLIYTMSFLPIQLLNELS